MCASFVMPTPEVLLGSISKHNDIRGPFHKTSLTKKSGLFKLVWFILNQIDWQ